MTRRLPLYYAALALVTAALYAAYVVPLYVALLVFAAGLGLLAVGTWRAGLKAGSSDADIDR